MSVSLLNDVNMSISTALIIKYVFAGLSLSDCKTFCEESWTHNKENHVIFFSWQDCTMIVDLLVVGDGTAQSCDCFARRYLSVSSPQCLEQSPNMFLVLSSTFYEAVQNLT